MKPVRTQQNNQEHIVMAMTWCDALTVSSPLPPPLARAGTYEAPKGKEHVLSFSPGTIIDIESHKPGDGWWSGKIGERGGFFPEMMIDKGSITPVVTRNNPVDS